MWLRYLCTLIRRVISWHALVSVRFVPHCKLGYILISGTSSLELKAWDVDWLVCQENEELVKRTVERNICTLPFSYHISQTGSWNVAVALCSCLHQVECVSSYLFISFYCSFKLILYYYTSLVSNCFITHFCSAQVHLYSCLERKIIWCTHGFDLKRLPPYNLAICGLAFESTWRNLFPLTTTQ